MNPALLATELRRAVRNRRTLFFSTVLPIIFFLTFASTHGKLGGMSVARYVMVDMMTYGAMNALFTGGGVIAAERSIGWTRQLRIAGLRPRDYVATKVVMSYVTALPGVIGVLVLAAAVKGIRMAPLDWVLVAVSVLVALIPVAILGVAVGYQARAQTLQAIFGIGSTLLALLGGVLIPVAIFPRPMRIAAEALPVYWAVEAGHDVLQHQWVGWLGVAVLGAWVVALGLWAGWSYRRDALRPSAAGTT